VICGCTPGVNAWEAPVGLGGGASKTDDIPPLEVMPPAPWDLRAGKPGEAISGRPSAYSTRVAWTSYARWRDRHPAIGASSGAGSSEPSSHLPQVTPWASNLAAGSCLDSLVRQADP